MTVYFQNIISPREGLAVATGAYSVKQIMTGKLPSLFKGAVVGAGSALLMQGKWELAGIAASIGTAASGWRDLSKMKIKSGLAKIFMGSAFGMGTSALVNGKEFGEMKLKDAALSSVAVAAAGLVQATVEGTWPYVVQAFKCATRTIRCCDKIAEAVSDCFKKRPDDRPQHGSSVEYC